MLNCKQLEGMENGAPIPRTKSRGLNSSPIPKVANGDVDRHSVIPRGVCNTHAGSNSPRLRKAYTGKKLVLHFDVRNTILVADSVDSISVEQALNSFLTGVTWGRDTDKGWEWFSDSPSLTTPHPRAITYYKHLEAQVVRIPSDRAKLRRMTGDFTQEAIGCKFASYFHRHLKYLEWPFSNTGDTEDMLTMNGKDSKKYHYILPAFYKLLHHLRATNRDFSVVIRTYGLDARNVLRSMRLTLEGKHPQFPEPLDMRLNPTPGAIKRRPGVINMELHNPNGPSPSVLRDERTIYNFLTESEGISAFVDDFGHWQDNGYSHSCAKPLWIDLSHKHVHHIFFDDNIRVSDSDSIVDVRVFDSASSQKARSLNHEDAAKLENVCLVQADLLESTSNANYFIDKVKTCERHYDNFLRSAPKR